METRFISFDHGTTGAGEKQRYAYKESRKPGINVPGFVVVEI